MKILVTKILFIAVLITLNCCEAFAQIVIKADNIDVIKVQKGKGQLSFYQKKEDQFRKIGLNLFKQGDDRFIPSDKWETYQEISASGDKVISVNSLRAYTPHALFNYLSKYQFLSFDEYKGDTTYYSLQLFNPYKALVREMDCLGEEYIADSDGEWPRYYFSVAAFAILQLRPDKCIVLYPDDDGYFIPERKDHIFVKDYPFDTVRVVKQQQDNRWKKHDEIIQQVTESYQFSSSDYEIHHTDSDKQILTDYYGNQLLPDNYDSIFKYRYFIFTYKNGKIEVYNLFLEPLFKNVRSYTLGSYPQLVYILIGNKVVMSDFKGTVSPDITHLPVRTKYSNSYYPRDYYHRDVRIDKKKNIYYCSTFFGGEKQNRGFTQRNDIILPENIRPDDASFSEYLLDMSSYNGKGGWFIVRRNDLYGLYFMPYPRQEVELKTVEKYSGIDTVYTGVPIECKELLPIVFDSIRPTNSWDHRLLIYTSGLTGIYPEQTEAKYLSIDKPNSVQLLRFVLPDGRKGWLNLKTKQEFLDL